MNSILEGFLVFIVSLILTGIIIPQILLIAFKKKLFDIPDNRKIHKGAVPRLGGIAFMPAIVFSLCFITGINSIFWASSSIGAVFTNLFDINYVIICFGLCALMLMYLIGIADDLIGVKYRAKFIGQIIATLLLAFAGVRINSLHGMLGIDHINILFSYILSIILFVYIINAFNLIDGIDGLASGLGSIAFAFYAITFYSINQLTLSLIALASLGTMISFFYYNVFGNPQKSKKIFMGDTGALTIGLILGFLSISMTTLDIDYIFNSNIMVVAFSPIAIPCLDVLRVFVHRIIRGRSPFLPDRVHIHHKFLALGIPHRITMILILILASIVIGFNLILSQFVDAFIILCLDVFLWVIFNWILTRSIHIYNHRRGLSSDYD